MKNLMRNMCTLKYSKILSLCLFPFLAQHTKHKYF